MFYQHNLLYGKCVTFGAFPLNKNLLYPYPKKVDICLKDLLSDISDFNNLDSKGKDNKIFIGFSSSNPSGYQRTPFWLSTEAISKHILIGGSIGSGKTSLTYRLLSGALANFGSVIIGEAKGGLKGYSEGAAFTDLSLYLNRKLGAKYYRFPRGNCWFNPLLYLESAEERKSFMYMISNSIEVESGDYKAYINRAAKIASLILEIINISCTDENKRKFLTLRQLSKCLKDPNYLQEEIINIIASQSKLDEVNKLKKELKSLNKSQDKANKINKLKRELELLNFFALAKEEGRDRFVMTATGINFFLDAIDSEDLFYYTEPNETGRDIQKIKLVELKIDDVLYEKTLVVISQPLSDPRSKVVGPIFWDTLLNRVLQLGPYPPRKNGLEREKVAVFLDETHRLPVGELGKSGDFLRQYNIGLIEITPSIIDSERWEQNKHIYQTLISLSPGVTDVLQLIHDRLPNSVQTTFQVTPEIALDNYNDIRINPKIESTQNIPELQDNPGISVRSMRNTGKFTALLHTSQIGDESGLFWIDLESPLLAHFEALVKEALHPSEGEEAARILDYALGLSCEYS